MPPEDDGYWSFCDLMAALKRAGIDVFPRKNVLDPSITILDLVRDFDNGNAIYMHVSYSNPNFQVSGDMFRQICERFNLSNSDIGPNPYLDNP